MSLSEIQKENTRKELRENFEKSGLSIAQIAADLETTADYIERLFALEPKRLEDTWILRNYLISCVTAQGKQPTAFSKLVGDWHDYWFLNGAYIDKGKINSR